MAEYRETNIFRGWGGFFYSVAFFLVLSATYFIFPQADAQVKETHWVVESGSAVECILSDEDYRSSATNWAIPTFILAIVTMVFMGLLGFLDMIWPTGSWSTWRDSSLWGARITLLVQFFAIIIAAVFGWLAYDRWNRLTYDGSSALCKQRYEKYNEFALIAAIFLTVAAVIIFVMAMIEFVNNWGGKRLIAVNTVTLPTQGLQIPGGYNLQPHVSPYGAQTHHVANLQQHQGQNAVTYYAPQTTTFA